MNCISGSILLTCLIGCGACGAPASETGPRPTNKPYAIHYTVTPDPSAASVAVVMDVQQSRGELRELSFSRAASGAEDFIADGDLDLTTERIRWRPARNGGRLQWRVHVPTQRNGDGYDAWLDEAWGIFRAEDIIPRAKSRTLKGATSNTTLTFELPANWSAITEYFAGNKTIVINIPDRRLDMPRGWIVVGKLGVRRERIAGIRVAIAAPEGQAVRRMDMLALLNWTLPELTTLVAKPPRRLTIISAGDPMWHGGLSAPGSLFIHADRPLISENATSTLLHEVVHITLGIRARFGYDWIAEGLAEYYSLETLRRAGAITTRRYRAALADQASWAESAVELCAGVSSGATTALAVVTFGKLEQELRGSTEGVSSLDDLVAAIVSADTLLDLDALADAAADLLGNPSDVLRIDNLPGCRTIAHATAETLLDH